MNITIDTVDLLKVATQLDLSAKEFNKAIKSAGRKTGTRATKKIADDVVKRTLFPKEEVKQSIRTKSSGNDIIITLNKSKRFGTRLFEPEQDDIGVSYQVDRNGKRLFVPGAFLGPKPGVVKSAWKGNAFIRTGKNRKPISKVVTVSPWGVYTQNNLVEPLIKDLSDFFQDRTLTEIRYILLKRLK